MSNRYAVLVAMAASQLALSGCCTPPIGKQLREEVLITRGSKVLMGGSIAMPPFTDATAVELLVHGTTEERIIELVGPPDRTLPAKEGELWVWDMEVFEQHMLLSLHVVAHRQRGPAIAEWRTIPDFIVHYDWLAREPDAEVSQIVDFLGSPTRWEIVGGTSFMIWECVTQLEHDEHWWRYSPDVYLHSLRLEVVDDRLQSVEPIVSRKLANWPRSAAMRVGR